MKGHPIRSPVFNTFEEGERWIEKQEERQDFEVLSSGCSRDLDGKCRAYVYGYRTSIFPWDALGVPLGSFKRAKNGK